FVAVGESDQNIGARNARRLQNARTGGIAVDGAYVEAILQVAQNLLVHVDDGDVVRLFTGEVKSGRPAHLSSTQDDDFHGNYSTRPRSEEHTSELQSHLNLVCRLLLEKKK